MRDSNRFFDVHGRNKPDGFYSDEFKDLISKTLCYNPENRLTINEIMEHP